MHKINNLKSSYHFLKNFLACCARSIAFYTPLRNENMQCACFTNSIYIFFVFWGVIILDWQLPKFTDELHKIAQNCVHNVQKLCAGMVAEKGGGKTWEWGEQRHGCWGIDAPEQQWLNSAYSKQQIVKGQCKLINAVISITFVN